MKRHSIPLDAPVKPPHSRIHEEDQSSQPAKSSHSVASLASSPDPQQLGVAADEKDEVKSDDPVRNVQGNSNGEIIDEQKKSDKEVDSVSTMVAVDVDLAGAQVAPARADSPPVEGAEKAGGNEQEETRREESETFEAGKLDPSEVNKSEKSHGVEKVGLDEVKEKINPTGNMEPKLNPSEESVPPFVSEGMKLEEQDHSSECMDGRQTDQQGVILLRY